MANPLSNEKELFERIKNENIRIIPEIWGLLYQRIGDDLTAINLLCHNYLRNNQPIPIEEAKQILLYSRHIKDIVNQITIVSKDKFPFPEFHENIPLHPIIREMLTHYIGNDLHMINFMVQDTIDPIEPHPIPQEIIQKILNHAHCIKDFMERLRIATLQPESPPKAQETPEEIPLKLLTKDEILAKIRKSLAQEFNLKEEQIQLTCRFKEDLGLDTIDTTRVMMLLEEEFALEIPDDAAEKLLSVNQVVDYLSR